MIRAVLPRRTRSGRRQADRLPGAQLREGAADSDRRCPGTGL